MPEGATKENPSRAGIVMELPSLGADMDHGTLLEWYVGPGDRVDRGSIVALVSTDKADVDVEIWQAGTVAELLVELGVELPVGAPILRLAAEGEEPGEADITAPPPSAEQSPAAPMAVPAPIPATATEAGVTPATAAGPPPAGAAPTSSRNDAGASPLARAAARAADIDLATIPGSGPGGAVLARDVEIHRLAATSLTEEVPAPARSRAQSMRTAIATRMATANREIPHYYLQHDVDMGPALAWLQARNADRPITDRILTAALLLKATAIAAAAVPELNGFWLDERFEPAPTVDLAVVVALRGGGLVTPKIANADQLDIEGVMTELGTIVANARRGTLRSSWLGQAGLTVSSLGDRGVDRLDGVIFPPQVALVGFGGIRKRPWIADDNVVARPLITISLAADHRASDGVIGSRFLSRIADYLDHPEES